MEPTRYLLILFVALLAASCEKEDPGPKDFDYKVVYVTSNLERDTAWSGENVYVIDMDEFQVEAILNIQAGAILKFRDGASLTVRESGKLNCQGSAEYPVIFTSLYDDSHGGDTNGDGSITSPEAADWTKVLLENESSLFHYCHFLYGGGGKQPTTLEADAVRVQILNCVFAHNTGGIFEGSYYGALDISRATGNSYVLDNGFYNNYLPLTSQIQINLRRGHYFFNPENPSERNTLMGIFLQGDTIHNMNLGETDVPYVFLNPSLKVTNSFGLNDNVIVKMPEGGSITICQEGAMFYTEKVIFTSFKDDFYGGDTNGDGSHSTPEKGDWIGIHDIRFPGHEFYVPGPNIRYAQFP